MKHAQIKHTPSAGAMKMPKQVKIEKAENGYIVRCNEYENDNEVKIAKNLKEAQKMMAEMMEKED